MTAKSYDNNDFFGVGSSNLGAVQPIQAEWQKNLGAAVSTASAATFISVLSIKVPGPGRYKVTGMACAFNTNQQGVPASIVSLQLSDGTTTFGGGAGSLLSTGTAGAGTTSAGIPFAGEILETTSGPFTFSLNAAFTTGQCGIGTGGVDIFGTAGGNTSSATQMFVTKVSNN